MKMIEIKNLSVKYKNFYALRNISFDIEAGDIVGIAGQSGSGKTTLLKAISQIEKGYDGEVKLNIKKPIQFVFQDPSSSLDPRMRIYEIVAESLLIKKTIKRDEVIDEVKETLNRVGLNSDLIFKYPFEISGGQKQRVAIARAIITKPELLICDEPISSLDISISAQILNLLKDLSDEYKFTLIFVSHDISSIYYLTKKVIILYRGEMMEWGDTQKIINRPVHPYTKLLISSILSTEKKPDETEIEINERETSSKCAFSSLCPFITDECINFNEEIKMVEEEHYIRCIKSNL
ncbi:MAG: ABC transporter ATP-binding protein [Elusimicrobiales bacterium]|jgi:peptide/nickel transport system ATP-binding protein|nr:ABC transporter ATP-binding protein [Elusimicrobiales bacterium]